MFVNIEYVPKQKRGYMGRFQGSARQGNVSGFYLIKNISKPLDSYVSIHFKIYANTKKYYCHNAKFT